jgi:hypothetical protein
LQCKSVSSCSLRIGCPLKAGGPPHFGDDVNFTETF